MDISEIALAIYKRASGATMQSIATEFNAHLATVKRAVNGERRLRAKGLEATEEDERILATYGITICVCCRVRPVVSNKHADLTVLCMKCYKQEDTVIEHSLII